MNFHCLCEVFGPSFDLTDQFGIAAEVALDYALRAVGWHIKVFGK